MLVENKSAHLTYCSNIHPGESWDATFSNLKKYTAKVRIGLKSKKFGIGLRLSNAASLELIKEQNLRRFKRWLAEENCYVFTVNGFPFGSFHKQVVKDQVHAPDWTTSDRLEYTKRLFDTLCELLPEGMHGGVSTSPLSYRLWHTGEPSLELARGRSTEHLADLMVYLSRIKAKTGKTLHLDLEPEPDGIIETTAEFVDFFENWMLKAGADRISEKTDVDSAQARSIVREHFRLCYDVCHFAVAFEKPAEAVHRIISRGIGIGKIQISAALGSGLIENQVQLEKVVDQLTRFDEPVYLHQSVIKNENGQLEKYPDLGPALCDLDYPRHKEIRTHFHVPVFTKSYQGLVSTQDDIIETLHLWKKLKFSDHLEVETYTWDVLPENMQTGIVDSIVRELNWVKDILK